MRRVWRARTASPSKPGIRLPSAGAVTVVTVGGAEEVVVLGVASGGAGSVTSGAGGIGAAGLDAVGRAAAPRRGALEHAGRAMTATITAAARRRPGRGSH